MTTLQCEICLHKLATVEELALPLTGAMFLPPDPWMPPPFAPELDWEWMRCPMCGKRPFTAEGRFLLFDQGRYYDLAPGLHRDPETGMLTGALVDRAQMPPVADDVAWPPATGAIDGIVGVATTATATNEDGEKVVTVAIGAKPPTVLEEVYRMADAGMKPGEISKELAKAGVVLHQLAIAAKLRAR